MGIKQVLIVDDSRLTRMIFAKVISNHHNDWEIFQAENGTKAIEMAKERQFDFISLDHNMPDMTGLDILPTLKELQENAHIGVFTANVQQVLLSRYEALGKKCYNKPIDEEKILEFIKAGELA